MQPVAGLTGPALAQTVGGSASRAAPDRSADSYLSALQRLRSGCENAAWTLWQSNSYERWRLRKSSMLAMNYSVGFLSAMPTAPESFPEALRSRLDDTMGRANDTLRDSGAAFKDLANYINAKDYEDDKFRRGDELNAKLLAYGRDCDALYAALTELFGESADLLIGRGAKAAARPEIVATMVEDWRRARELSRELAKGSRADAARLDILVRDVSALAEERKRAFEPALQGGSGTLPRFYDRMLTESVAVPMRKLLREARTNPKEFQDAAADRPRSGFRRVRNEIDFLMPDAILHFIRHGS